jgi:hypothetical protein
MVEEDIRRNNLIIQGVADQEGEPVRNKRKKESLKNIRADSMQVLR